MYSHSSKRMVINAYTTTLDKSASYGNLATSVTSSMQMEDDFMLPCRWVGEGKISSIEFSRMNLCCGFLIICLRPDSKGIYCTWIDRGEKNVFFWHYILSG